MAKRTARDQEQHDLAIRRICRARLSRRPGWEFYTNPGDCRNYALVLPDGARVYPDIVGRRRGDGSSSYIAEVETESTVTEGEAAQWKQFAELGKRFILYIPAGSLLYARELCHAHGIAVHGYRVYELTRFWIRIRDFRV